MNTATSWRRHIQTGEHMGDNQQLFSEGQAFYKHQIINYLSSASMLNY